MTFRFDDLETVLSSDGCKVNSKMYLGTVADERMAMERLLRPSRTLGTHIGKKLKRHSLFIVLRDEWLVRLSAGIGSKVAETGMVETVRGAPEEGCSDRAVKCCKEPCKTGFEVVAKSLEITWGMSAEAGLTIAIERFFKLRTRLGTHTGNALIRHSFLVTLEGGGLVGGSVLIGSKVAATGIVETVRGAPEEDGSDRATICCKGPWNTEFKVLFKILDLACENDATASMNERFLQL